MAWRDFLRGIQRRVRLRSLLRSEVRRLRACRDSSRLAAISPAGLAGRRDVDLGRFGRTLRESVDAGFSGKSTW
jgi:hypothetical protein